jgi:hypothetical protein
MTQRAVVSAMSARRNSVKQKRGKKGKFKKSSTYLAFNLVYYLNMSLIDQSYYMTAPQGVRLNGVSLVK